MTSAAIRPCVVGEIIGEEWRVLKEIVQRIAAYVVNDGA
jgi:hypothetical protein